MLLLFAKPMLHGVGMENYIIPNSFAFCRRLIVLLTLNLRNRFLRWLSTVRELINIFSATMVEVNPSSRYCKTSLSLLVIGGVSINSVLVREVSVLCASLPK